MATYQEFIVALRAQLSDCTDTELVTMVEDLIAYTEGIMDDNGINPPPLSPTDSSSRGMSTPEMANNTTGIPPISPTGGSSNVTG